MQLTKLHESGYLHQNHAAQLQPQQPAPGARLSREMNTMMVRNGNPNEADVDADAEYDSDASVELHVDSSLDSSVDSCNLPATTNLRVTVMLRNLPNNYSRRMLLELMDQLGFVGNYDFVYLPIDFKTQASLGYAFVNLTSSDDAKRFWKCFSGYSEWALPSQKVCKVNWSLPYQGLAAHIERYRNSPVMHEAVPDDFKPAIFSNGERTSFPPPTKKIRAPRMRPGRSYLRSALAA
jgi:RNA recognition motif-containing protein